VEECFSTVKNEVSYSSWTKGHNLQVTDLQKLVSGYTAPRSSLASRVSVSVVLRSLSNPKICTEMPAPSGCHKRITRPYRISDMVINKHTTCEVVTMPSYLSTDCDCVTLVPLCKSHSTEKREHTPHDSTMWPLFPFLQPSCIFIEVT
jgi:hypothetical protein